MRNSLKTFVSFPWLLVPRTLLHAKGCCLSLKDLRDPRGEFPFLAEDSVSCLHQHHHPSGTGSGTVGGWVETRVLSCALGPGTGKEGRLLRKRRSLEGNGAFRKKWGSWEGNEALGVADSECTDLRPWRREVRRPPGP